MSENENRPPVEGGNGGNRKRRRNRGKHRGGERANNGGLPVNSEVHSGQKQERNKPQKQQQPQQPRQKPQKPQKNQPQKNQQQKSRAADKGADNRKDTYVYVLDNNLYINLTNKCSNGCDFCVRNERTSYFGNYLWIRHGDPTAEKVIAAINGFGDLSRFKELVFCGFGEPTYKMEELCAVAEYAHSRGLKTRLNTNGQGNLINKRDIVPELKGKIDLVNVSLNAPDAESYRKICRSMFGEEGYSALVEFAKNCKRNGVNCRFSVVDSIGEEAVESCKRFAESVNIPIYIRKYIADS
ncbi:MAG: radical SAM protein [Clostridia bacterium]|nr:radical SAM protein [Clostridia bacterium]